MTKAYLFLAAALAAAPGLASAQAAQNTAPKISPAARAVHDAAIVLDTHFDTPALFSRPGWDFADRHAVTKDGSQVDLPRMVDGGVDGGFFAIYTAQGPRTKAGDDAARAAALVRAVEIHEMLVKHSDKIEIALKADDAARIVAKGKRFAYLSMENAYPLAGDPGMLDAFYALGVRMVGFAHFKDNDFADSATDKPEWGGLSPKGKALLEEMNRLGVIPDPSHSSDAVLAQVIEQSKTPVVLSHSGVRAVFDHPRNVPDDLLKKLAERGGVIQINAFSSYMIPPPPPNPEREKALAALGPKYGPRDKLTEAKVVEMVAERRAILAKYPMPRANLEDLMAHLLYALKLIGPDHVGLSGDFDGGGGVDGYDSIADLPIVTERLLKAGYSKDDIAKIWGGNVLRVLRETEAYVASQK
ncbi:dipeptidase [Caulobacter segnis]|uniref:dipeptidase n=1 Tax=Caulobacter segnis TaxID=88688 RepID=UPI001CBAB06B|nr:dipeptidase [Caulobacter segnis]UAL12397.1 dipeptidase [Caulobacter segnis]